MDFPSRAMAIPPALPVRTIALPENSTLRSSPGLIIVLSTSVPSEQTATQLFSLTVMEAACRTPEALEAMTGAGAGVGVGAGFAAGGGMGAAFGDTGAVTAGVGAGVLAGV